MSSRAPYSKTRFLRSPANGAGVRVRPVFDDFHLLKVQAALEYPLHQHRNYELILVERGPYRCLLNHQELTVQRGEMLLIKPGDLHSDHLRPRQRHCVVHFRLASNPEGKPPPALFAAQVPSEWQICRGTHTRELQIIRELRREAEERKEHSAAIQDCFLEALFWRVVRALRPQALSLEFRRLPRQEALRERIWAILQNRVAQNVSFVRLARELGVSPRQFHQLCRDLFHDSPARLFLRVRINFAEELLRDGRSRVKEVSEQLGFSNPYHFSRAFRRVTGRSPSQG